MAANLPRLFTSLCTRNTIVGQSTTLSVLCATSWCNPCSKNQSSGYHTSDYLYGGQLKSVWRRKRVPAWTKLCLDKPEKFKTRKAFGGWRKMKVTRAKEGLYTWKSQNIEFQSPILDVVLNTAHKHFTENKIMVKGSIVEVDAEKFRIWFDEQCKFNKIEEDKHDFKKNIDEQVLYQIKNGKVLAKVSSRPGQVGKVDGYLLEGDELKSFLDQNKTETSLLTSKT